MILGENFNTYENGLARLNLETLASRREQLCLSFAIKCVKNPKLNHMFPTNEKPHEMKTRNVDKFKIQFANTGRLQNSPIIYMQKLLNENEK